MYLLGKHGSVDRTVFCVSQSLKLIQLLGKDARLFRNIKEYDYFLVARKNKVDNMFLAIECTPL